MRGCKKERKEYRIAAIYDTETTNVGEGAKTRAFPVLYIFNDMRGRDIRTYSTGDDNVQFFRTVEDALSFLRDLVAWGKKEGVVPIVAAYNLMFDMQSFMSILVEHYNIKVCAQSGTNVYTMDLEEPFGGTVLRFWDTFFLEQRGLAAMGRTCGLAKATGDWDYTLVRTPETPLTSEELFYAGRDTQVIPAYLRFLLESYPWMKEEELGVRILTKTSIVRQMSRHEIANLQSPRSEGKGRLTVGRAFENLCMAELPKDYDEYAERKACFRGGWTFTSMSTAGQVVPNVASMDVTSMHHTYINGRRVPVRFHKTTPDVLLKAAEEIVSTTREQVLAHYDAPFRIAIHARIRFDNVRLREGSPFEAWGIALEPEAKFSAKVPKADPLVVDREGTREDEEDVRSRGYYDRAFGAVFAFGKLVSADVAYINMTEVELWTFSRVYEWDSMDVDFGEISFNWVLPPDYVTLQSNVLWSMKNAAKHINNTYKQGEPYSEDIPQSVPQGIAELLRSGEATQDFVRSWYQVAVKGSFNGLYGVQAQNVFRSNYHVPYDEGGRILTDKATVVTPETFPEKLAEIKHCMVLYTYGMRIVGGSRQHLAIAMELLFEALGSRVRVTGGDTDSMKVSCEYDVTDDELREAVLPLEEAIDGALARSQRRIRENFPGMASDLVSLGHFDVEDAGNSKRYLLHYESWNKARISLDSDLKPHITAAGLSRPAGAYTIEDWVSDMIAEDPEHLFPHIAGAVLGYNTIIRPEVAHAIMSRRPEPGDLYNDIVRDYMGNASEVIAPEVIALYSADREVGDTMKLTNAQNVQWLEDAGRRPDTRQHVIGKDEHGPFIYWMEGTGGYYERAGEGIVPR